MFTQEQVESLINGCSYVVCDLNIPPELDDGLPLSESWGTPAKILTNNDRGSDWDDDTLFCTTAEDGEWWGEYSYNQMKNATLDEYGNIIVSIPYAEGCTHTLRFITKNPMETVYELLNINKKTKEK